VHIKEQRIISCQSEYKEEMLNMVKGLNSGMKVIVSIEKQDNILALTDVISTDGATN